MENINIGIINLIISEMLKKSYFNDSLLEESKTITNDFIRTVKKSPLLFLEFKIFDNIENKHIDNDLIATRYIDNNIKLFEIYTINEINDERKKLNNIYNEKDIISINNRVEEKIKLYEAINTLIIQSLTNYDDVDVDSIHESFNLVLNHIKKPKNTTTEKVNIINENILEIAIEKFNEKYSPLTDDDKILLHNLINFTLDKKKELYEEYKLNALSLLEKVTDKNIVENIQKAIDKIKNMETETLTTIDDKIISLHELKRGLLM